MRQKNKQKKPNLKRKTSNLVYRDRIMIICEKHGINLPAPEEGYIQSLMNRHMFNECQTEHEVISKLKELI